VLQVPSDTDAPDLCTAGDPNVLSMSSYSQQQNPGHKLDHVNNSVTEAATDNNDLNLSKNHKLFKTLCFISSSECCCYLSY